MAEPKSTAKEALQHLYASIPIAAGMAFEARCSDTLEALLPQFITGAEGSPVDCGISETLGYNQQLDPDERLRHVLSTENTQILTMDFKTINPRPCALRKGVIYDYSIGIKAEQVHCSAFIIQNPAFPSLTALVPHYILDHYYLNAKNEKRRYYSREAPFFGTKFNAYPTEWGPLVMDKRYLPEALVSFEKFSLGREKFWRNPHNGLEFTDFPRPRLQAANLLVPNDRSHLTDSPLISRIQNAINQRSNRYAIAGMKIRSKLGDFLITHRASSTTITTELKRNCAYIDSASNLVHAASFRNLHSGALHVYFSPLTSWDWLFTTLRNDRLQRALFINRNDLPSEWFNPPCGHYGDRDLCFHYGEDFIGEHSVSMLSDQTLVDDMERILDRAFEKSSFQAQPPKGHLLSASHNFSAVLGSDIHEDSVEDFHPRSAPVVRGEGKNWSQRMYEATCEERLRQQCFKCGNGSIFRLGMHPSATHVFTPVVAETIFDLDPKTPMLYINFAPIDINLHKVGNNARKRATMYHATHGQSKSIYILDPLPYHMNCPIRDCFLVPSDVLNTAIRRQAHETFLTSSVADGFCRQLYLSRNELIDVYASPYPETIPQLLRFFSQPVDADTILFGRRDVGFDVSLNLDDYLKTQREVLGEFVPLLAGTSFWGKRGRSKGPDVQIDFWDQE